MIFSPTRMVDLSTVQGYVDMAKQLMDTYPQFVMGFDLVGEIVRFL